MSMRVDGSIAYSSFESIRSQSGVAGAERDDVQAAFRDRFSALAGDRAAFHDFMRQVYGPSYDRASAEELRQSSLGGDFSWLPPVVYVDAQTLGGANGAYDADGGVIYLSDALLGDPELAAETFMEEAGHHLDTLLKVADTAGDEGEMFRRLLGGEDLGAAERHAIRTENDRGVIVVDGREVEVEFWNPFSAAADAVGSALDKVGDAMEHVAEAVGDGMTGIGEGFANTFKSVYDAGADFFGGLWNGVSGFATNLFQGNLLTAFDELYRGLDEAILQAPGKLVGSLSDAAFEMIDGATEFLGPAGKYVRKVTSRVSDIVRTAVTLPNELVRDAAGALFEIPFDFVSGLWDSAKLLADGNWSGALAGVVNAPFDAVKRGTGAAVDATLRALQGITDIVAVGTTLQPPSRGLTDVEKELLRSIYGDSLDLDAIRIQRGSVTEDLGLTPHAVGNTLYLNQEDGKPAVFNPDGSLTMAGLQMLVHEAGHAWQSQHGGGDYIHKALGAQYMASRGSGTRDDAYDWQRFFDRGVAFEDLNPEAQAGLIGDVGRFILVSGSTDPADWTTGLTADELTYLLDAWDQVKNGQGAP